MTASALFSTVQRSQRPGAGPASRPFVEKAIANNGFLPNLIGVLANSPQALQTYMTVSGINSRTTGAHHG
jgi:hypothetical protein